MDPHLLNCLFYVLIKSDGDLNQILIKTDVSPGENLIIISSYLYYLGKK